MAEKSLTNDEIDTQIRAAFKSAGWNGYSKAEAQAAAERASKKVDDAINSLWRVRNMYRQLDLVK